MSTIDELVNAIDEIQHNERPCLENLLCLKKLEMEREPVDRIHREAVTKV
jgi:hypothetical protein